PLAVAVSPPGLVAAAHRREGGAPRPAVEVVHWGLASRGDSAPATALWPARERRTKALTQPTSRKGILEVLLYSSPGPWWLVVLAALTRQAGRPRALVRRSARARLL